MGLLAPMALAALPLLGIIVALYLLKLRRPVAPIASLHLWDTLTRDREANSLWQRLRVSTLLILQFLALLVLILALARPWVTSEGNATRNVVMVIDVSASMGSSDPSQRGGRTRLDIAKEKAHSIVNDLPQNGTATLISADDHAEIVVPATGDKARLRRALDDLKSRLAGSSMVEAMQIAGAVSASEESSVIWVLSDGAFPSTTELIDEVRAEVRFFHAATRASNQAITAMSLQPKAGTLSLFIQVANSSDVSETRRLDITVDDAAWSSRNVSVGPGSTAEILVDDVPIAGRVIRATLAESDALTLDDSAWVVNRSSVPAKVLLVSEGDRFLELSLSLLPTVELYKVIPSEYDSYATIDGAAVDLTVFDSNVLSSTFNVLPPGNLLFVGPQASNELLIVRGTITNPVPSMVTSQAGRVDSAENGQREPLLRYVDISNLQVAKASLFDIPSWGRVVIDSDQGPLLVAGQTPERKIAAMAFDLQDSDLPLQSAFPLLMRNLVTFLLPEPAGGMPASVLPNDPVGIEALDERVKRILVEDPAGREWVYDLPESTKRLAFAETSLAGVYYVTQYAAEEIIAQEAFAVNMFSRDEALATPNASPGLPVQAEVTAEQQGRPAQQAREEIWPLVALAGLLLLLLEWLYAQRIAVRRALTELRTRRALERGQES